MIQAATGKYDELLTFDKETETRRFCYSLKSSGLAKTTPVGIVEVKRSKGRKKEVGRQNLGVGGVDFASLTRVED